MDWYEHHLMHKAQSAQLRKQAEQSRRASRLSPERQSRGQLAKWIGTQLIVLGERIRDQAQA